MGMDYLALTTQLDRVTERGRWAPLLAALETYVETRLSGTTIRVASGQTASEMVREGTAGWVVAKFAEPAMIALREGLRPGETVWHAARLAVRLTGSPLALTPGEVGLIGSAEIPERSWPEGSPENATDHLAIGLLLSLGASRRQALKFARFHI